MSGHRRWAAGAGAGLCALAFASALCAQSAPTVTVDWPRFLARQDLVWSRLPRGWGESAFIGNGLMGATIDVEDGVLGWTINRTDVVHDASRYPIGRLYLKTVGVQRSGTARLRLWDAEASGVVQTDSGEVRWRSFVPHDPSVIVIELAGTGSENNADVEWLPADARPPRKIARRDTLGPEDLHPAPMIIRSQSGFTSVQPFIGGDAHAETMIRETLGNGARVFYVTIGYAKTADSARAEAQRVAATASTNGIGALSATHRTWWHAYYPRSFLSFPDARLESYYWIQIYKLASAMRSDGPILDLNGPWFRATPWPAIWWNLNIQLTYSPLFKANRVDLAESLFRNLDRGRQALIENAPARLQGGAAAIGRSSGPDLVRKVDLATATSDAAKEMGNLPWTMFYYWQHYRYQMDDRILRDRVYPLLKLAIGNYLAYVEKGTDGTYHLPATHSPELATIPDANYDLALLQWGLETLIASATRLRLGDPMLPRWREVLAKLTPQPRDSTGLLVGRDRPWKESHRHYSHLLGVYPLALWRADRAEDRDVIERSLRTWEGPAELFRGYSFTGGAAMHAWLGHGDEALERLNKYLEAPRYMLPNTFYAEAGPVIETPFSAAASIQEMFVQDWGTLSSQARSLRSGQAARGICTSCDVQIPRPPATRVPARNDTVTVRVFPAMPTVWKDASFDKLRTDGAFLVSAVRANGRTAWVRITSLAGQPLRVIVPGWDSAFVREGMATRRCASTHPDRIRAICVIRDSALVLDLRRDQSVLLTPDRRSSLPALAPVPRTDSVNVWPTLTPDSVRPLQDSSELAWWRTSMERRDERLAWWREARFGMFIHWGAYSQLGGIWEGTPVRGYAEHIQRIRRIPSAEYRAKAVSQFNPTGFDAAQWIATAKRAGMGYMIITAKHHDGFAMYDSKVSDYNIVAATPFRRDPLRELRDEARRQGLKFGFYYSHAFDWGDREAPGNDWEYDNPGGDRNLHGGRDWWLNEPQYLAQARRYVDRKAIPQIVELIKRYDPDIMWFDTPHKLPPEENLRILRAAREAKPTLVINGRAVQPLPGGPEARFGDYASTADRPAELMRHDGDWEAIPTTNESYGYHRMDLSHKPPEHFVQLLSKAAARGGNLLLNIGPMGDGRFDPKDAAILVGIGDWMQRYGESIRGTSRTPLPVQTWGQSTRKGSRIYLHAFDWPSERRLHVAGVRAEVTRAFVVGDSARSLRVRRLGPRDVELEVPANAPDRWVSVLALDLVGAIEPDSVIYLPSVGRRIALHVFDGRRVGTGVSFGDGKRNRDVTTSWNGIDSGIDWDVRLTEPATFHVALNYATSSPADSGRFEILAGGQRLAGAVVPTASDTLFHSRDVGELSLPAGEHTLRIRPLSIPGAELMRLRAIELVPRASTLKSDTKGK